MWRRVGGAISCAACLLLACGKSEHDQPTPDDSAGANTGGVSATSSGTTNSAGSSASKGGNGAMGGRMPTAGAATTSGGQAEAGAPIGGEPSEGGAASCSGSYHACGCGCCDGQAPSVTCVYPELGQDLSSIMGADIVKRHDTAGCANAGCSIGVDYVCCESPTPTAEQATYETSLVIGGIDRIRISKMAGLCSTLTLRQALPNTPAQPGFPLETPAGWQMEQATTLPCISSAVGPRAVGAIGNVSLRVLGDACVADVHLALFFGDAVNGIAPERFDADGLSVDLPVAQCH